MRDLPTPEALLKKMGPGHHFSDGIIEATIREVDLGDYHIEVWEEADSASAGLWIGPHDSDGYITKKRATSKEVALSMMILELGKWAENYPISSEFEEWFFPPRPSASALSRVANEDLF